MTGRPVSPKQPRTTPAIDEAAFKAEVQDWLAHAGRSTDVELAAIRTTVAALPGRQTGRRRHLLGAAASIVVLLGLGGLVIGRMPAIGLGAQPPDPRAYAGDPRLAACRDRIGDVARAFEMTHARWFPLYFPGWGLGADELEVDEPALVVLGPEAPLPAFGGPVRALGQTIELEPRRGYQMCIAVGAPPDARIHEYSWTPIRKIVPVLSAADIDRAERLDPDVLADPATWPNPERLAPCGGLTSEVQYVFDATRLRDFARYFPTVDPRPVAAFNVDEPATVVVFRGRANVALQPLTVSQDEIGGPRHDVCVIFSQPSAGRGAVLIQDLDISGFHLRIEDDPLPPPPTPAPTPRPTITPQPAPLWASGIGSQLACDGPVADIGGEVPGALELDATGPTPREGLDAFLGPSNMYASLPSEGFEELNVEGHWASFGHSFGGALKAIVVLSDTPIDAPPGWTVRGLRACDASEFDPEVALTWPVTIWTDASGQRVSTATIHSQPGPGHCGWDSAIWLDVGPDLYFRDPKGVMNEWTATPFDANAELPARAVDTGFRSGGRELWLDPRGDAYLVSPGRVERWPRSTDPGIGCM
jgi:hypothetical protein